MTATSQFGQIPASAQQSQKALLPSPFSSSSSAFLDKANPKLQALFGKVAELGFDCTILDSIRTVEAQKEFVAKGLSKTMASKHLPGPDGLSQAVDAAPYPQHWTGSGPSGFSKFEVEEVYFAGFVKGVAAMLGIPIRWGGDWNRNNTTEDNSFNDLDHFELDSVG